MHPTGLSRFSVPLSAAGNGGEGSSQSKKRSRTIHKLSETPSLISTRGDHDCTVVDRDTTIIKVAARFFFSAFQFAMAFGLQCSTSRGPTLGNGAQCHCGGLCEACHAAVTPNLKDDKLLSVINKLKEKPLGDLFPIDRGYFQKRFSLTPEQEGALNSKNLEIRMECVDQVIERLEEEEYSSTFANTSIGKIRNATFANPRASNRVDCYLERVLVDFEQQLAEKCAKSEISPKDALLLLQERYKLLLIELRGKLDSAQESLLALVHSHEEFRQAHRDLLEQMRIDGLAPSEGIEAENSGFLSLKEQSPFFNTVFQRLDKFQKEKILIKAIHFWEKANEYYCNFEWRWNSACQGTVTLSKDLENKARPQWVLPAIVKNSKGKPEEVLRLVRIHQSNLSPAQDLSKTFQEICQEIARRIDEVDAQSVIVFEDFNAIYEPIKTTLYASSDAERRNPFQTPPQNEMGVRFLAFISQLTPTRSDLFKKKVSSVAKRVFRESVQDKKEEKPFSSPIFSVAKTKGRSEKEENTSPNFESEPLFELPDSDPLFADFLDS